MGKKKMKIVWCKGLTHENGVRGSCKGGCGVYEWNWKGEEGKEWERRRQKLHVVTWHTHKHQHRLCNQPSKGLEAVLSVLALLAHHLINDQRPLCLCICVSVDVCVIKPSLIILSACVSQGNKGHPQTEIHSHRDFHSPGDPLLQQPYVPEAVVIDTVFTRWRMCGASCPCICLCVLHTSDQWPVFLCTSSVTVERPAHKQICLLFPFNNTSIHMTVLPAIGR